MRKQFELADQISLNVVGYLESPLGYVGEIRCHTYWELMYINQGNGFVEYKNKPHRFADGDLLLVEPSQKHRIHLTGDDSIEMLYLGFTMNFDTTFHFIKDIPLTMYANKKNHIIKKVLKNVTDEMRGNTSKKIDNVTSICSILYILAIIIHSLADEDDDGDSITNSKKALFIEKTKTYLEENIDRQVSIHEIAVHVNLSEHYCINLFRNYFGISPKKYHSSLRMTLAAELLKDKNNAMSISEIADNIGFSSVHYFSKKFKEYYIVSPSRFRNHQIS